MPFSKNEIVTALAAMSESTDMCFVLTISGDQQNTYVMTIVIQSPWMDSLSNTNCGNLGFMRIVCNEVLISITYNVLIILFLK